MQGRLVVAKFGNAAAYFKSLTPISEEDAADETRAAEGARDAAGATDARRPSTALKENRWKLAFRQLVFMKRMNMQFNVRAKNEIELRQQNIAPLSLMCSVPYFNALAPDEIRSLVVASVRERLRPGESKALASAQELFYVVISGTLALARATAENARAVKQAELLPTLQLGIGDFFATHAASAMKVVALEPVECLAIPMRVIEALRPLLSQQIQFDTKEPSCRDAESESFKQWALQFSVASTKCEFPSAAAGGLAQCSAKAFCRDHFPHMSPENELDHTLEHTRAALTSIFAARRVRVYGVDEVNDRLLVKFSDERLPRATVGTANTVATRVLETRRPVFVANGSLLCRESSDVVASMLYHPDDMVLAAPFFEYFPLSVHRPSPEPARIVGILEVAITSSDSGDPRGVTATANDLSILEITAQELGRYLYFHYTEFFDVPQPAEKPASVNSEDEAHVEALDESELASETFPAPDVSAADDARTLVVSLNSVEVDGPDAISSAEVHVELGRMPLVSRVIPLACPASPTKERRAAQAGSPRAFSFERASVEMGISLANIPHGSHLRVLLKGKSGAAVAWTGLHLFDFGHALRTGRLLLDLRSVASGVVTPLDVENCLKRDRPAKSDVVGKLELTLECSGPSAQGFAFSSISKKKSITFRASIFYNAGEAKPPDPLQLAEALAALPAKKQRLISRVKKDPLVLFSADDRRFVWESRAALVEEPELLPTFLLAVDWSRREQVMEAYRLLILWRPPTYLQALQLLSPAFPDPKVRAYAVRCIHALPDHRLRLYLPQLVQVLKNERYHDSALARFLLMRGLLNPSQIGYLLYWYLTAEAHVDQTAERFELIVSQYLQLCGSFKLELRQSVYVMKKLEAIAAAVKLESTPQARKEKLQYELKHAVLPETFQIPLHPRTYYSTVIVDKCRVMESKKRPLFLQLENAKAQLGCPYVIFKSGDDLRQDQLVIQILRVMDDLWGEAGLDLCLTPYSCISTGNETGMIEVVGDSETLASIIYGRHDKSRSKLGRKLKSAKDALVKDTVISDWLFSPVSSEARPGDATAASPPLSPPTSPSSAFDHGTPTGDPPAATPSAVQAEGISLELPTPRSPSESATALPSVSTCFPLSPSKLLRGMSKRLSPTTTPPPLATRDNEITQNFIRSCAGYCVATFVLGIGDRHNDNLMLQRSGKFFHIDFGHFLGNFKSKMGVKRERAPFVFTPAMLDVIGGKKSTNYEAFKTLACDAFQVLRAHSNLLITLLVLALTCGIPELASADDIKWVHKALMIEFSDEEAAQRFRRLIDVALKTKATQLNDAVHLMAH